MRQWPTTIEHRHLEGAGLQIHTHLKKAQGLVQTTFVCLDACRKPICGEEHSFTASFTIPGRPAHYNTQTQNLRHIRHGQGRNLIFDRIVTRRMVCSVLRTNPVDDGMPSQCLGLVADGDIPVKVCIHLQNFWAEGKEAQTVGAHREQSHKLGVHFQEP